MLHIRSMAQRITHGLIIQQCCVEWRAGDATSGAQERLGNDPETRRGMLGSGAPDGLWNPRAAL
jgi:hypothetical protein